MRCLLILICAAFFAQGGQCKNNGGENINHKQEEWMEILSDIQHSTHEDGKELGESEKWFTILSDMQDLVAEELAKTHPGKTPEKEAFEDYPFRNISLPWDERVDDLVSRLTLQELISQTLSNYYIQVPGIERLGIKPYIWLTECLHGVAYIDSTAFPQSIGLSAAFSSDLVFGVADAISNEMRGNWNHNAAQDKYETFRGLSCLSPVVNIMRHPLWGRNQETYGEDPYLTSVMGRAYVQGLQGTHPRYVKAMGGCKHYNTHGGPENIPENRWQFDAVVSMRDVQMTFLPGFKSCVDAGSLSLMCSYNKINGTPLCANEFFLNKVTREQWGFKGYIISDGIAIWNLIFAHNYFDSFTDAVSAAIKAGCNIELIGFIYLYAKRAIEEGKLTEEDMRNNAKPLFYSRMRVGEFDPPELNPYTNINITAVHSKAHHDLAEDAAVKSFVLMKNLKNTLPLTATYKKVSIVGPMIHNMYQQYGGYSPAVSDEYSSTPLDTLSKLGETYAYAEGCDDMRCNNYDGDIVKEAADGSDVVIVCLGTGRQVESEFNDRYNISLPGYQEDLLKDAVHAVAEEVPVILLLFNAGPLDITWAKDSDRVSAILEAFFPAMMGGNALYRSLTATGNGDIPGGRLPATWPADMSQVFDITNYTMVGRTYRYYNDEPMYPFGYGLSYSEFNYKNLVINPKSIKAGENISLAIEVTNIGNYDADEVVQFYMLWDDTSLPAPYIQLVGFHRVHLKKGETMKVVSVVTGQQMALWMNDDDGFAINTGSMTVFGGGQQPNQKMTVPSNVLSGKFNII